MNCNHTNEPCGHAAYCTLNTPEARVEMCANFVQNKGSNALSCSACATKPCRFRCFRMHIERHGNDCYATMKERGEFNRPPTPYQLMRASGELAAQREATAAKMQGVQNALDNGAQRGV